MDRGAIYSILGVAWVFGWAFFALLASHLSNQSRQKKLELLHAERMKAMEKGVPLPELPELDALSDESWSSAPHNPRRPLGIAAILIAGGIGTSVALLLSGRESYNDIWSLGLIGVFLGIGFLLNYWLTRQDRTASND